MTARRYTGAHSPEAHSAPPPKAGGFWSRAMFFAPAPLLFSIYGEILRGDAVGIATELGAGAALILAAQSLREGLKAEAAWHARASAARPPIPRKVIASLLTALGVGVLAGAAWGLGPVAGGAYGILAGVVHCAAFGIDPLRAKGLAAARGGDAKRANEALAEAEALITDTLSAARRLGDQGLAGRVRALCASARPVLVQIEQDPRDLHRARRFLSITLTGARDATVKYARLGVEDPDLRAAFVSLLTQLETSFAKQSARLTADDRAELEIEIEVLSDRLRQDGAGGAR